MSDRPLSPEESALIEQHAGLVSQAVSRIKLSIPTHVSCDDLHGAAVEGLVKAARRYDPARNGSFSAWAFITIRGAIYDELRRLDWCPRRTRDQLKQIKHTRHAMEQRLRRSCTFEEVCGKIAHSRRSFRGLMVASQAGPPVAIDVRYNYGDGGSATLAEILPDDAAPPASAVLERAELMERLAAALAALPSREKKVLTLYYFEKLGMAEIGEVLGLTVSRISQIHADACRRIREALAKDQ